MPEHTEMSTTAAYVAVCVLTCDAHAQQLAFVYRVHGVPAVPVPRRRGSFAGANDSVMIHIGYSQERRHTRRYTQDTHKNIDTHEDTPVLTKTQKEVKLSAKTDVATHMGYSQERTRHTDTPTHAFSHTCSHRHPDPPQTQKPTRQPKAHTGLYRAQEQRKRSH